MGYSDQGKKLVRMGILKRGNGMVAEGRPQRMPEPRNLLQVRNDRAGECPRTAFGYSPEGRTSVREFFS